MAIDRVFDVAVVGGGINGAAIARDCAMRRLSVALFDKDDIASNGGGPATVLVEDYAPYVGTSELAPLAASELALLGRLAPNFLRRTPLLLPVLRDDPSDSLDRAYTLAISHHGLAPSREAPYPFRLSAAELQSLDPGLSAQMAGGVMTEATVCDAARLTVLTAKSAEASGAEIFLGCPVEAIETHNGRVAGVAVRYRGERRIVRTKAVILATGAWTSQLVPTIAALPAARTVKQVYLSVEGRLLNFALAGVHRDGVSPLFLVPSDEATRIGPLTVDFHGDPDRPAVSVDEVGELVEAARRYFPRLTDYRITHVDVSVHQRPARLGCTAGEVSPTPLVREHAQDGIEGLISVASGAIAVHRHTAEYVTNLACRYLKSRDECRTRLESLPGCTTEAPWTEESRRTGLEPLAVRGIIARHGYRARPILEEATKSPELARMVCECRQIIAGEVVHAVKDEWAGSLAALERRTGLGAGACRGSRCAMRAALLIASLRGKTAAAARAETADYLDRQRRAERLVLCGDQAVQRDYCDWLEASSCGELDP